jgi:hypothetical protein
MPFFRLSSIALLIGVFVTSLMVVLAAFGEFWGDTVIPLVVGAVFLGSFLLPQTFVGLALIALPFGGNRPATPHALYAVLVGAALFLGIALRMFLADRRVVARITSEILHSTVLFAGLVFCVLSVASLLSLPLPLMGIELRNAVDRSGIAEIAYSIIGVLRGNEHSPLYSLVSVYLTSLSFFLAVFVCSMCRAGGERTIQLFLSSIGLGLATSFVLGILDYYHLIDISSFRELDPIVNPGAQQFRMQSVFAHSGWFAEYVTLAMPVTVMILSLRTAFWKRTAIILGFLLLGEFVLILTYQRGGWLSYPLTLLAVWAAIYVVRCLERGEPDVVRALKRSTLKVVVSLPITVIASLLLVLAFQNRDSADAVISKYADRFADISKTSDRTEFFMAGLLIGSKHPLLGAGSDSFAWQFEQEFDAPEGAFAGRYTLPLHGSAHNVYAQTFSGKGLAGLLSLVSIPILLIVAAFRRVPSPALATSAKLTLLTGACFACAFLVYGNVQEIFYIQVLQYLFFAMVGITAAVIPSQELQEKTLRRLGLLFGVLIALHLVWEYAWPATLSEFNKRARSVGCYTQERLPTGEPFTWCKEHAQLVFARPEGAHSLSITLEAGPQHQEIRVTGPDGTSQVTALMPGEQRQVIVPLPQELTGNSVVVSFDASNAFVPKRLWPDNLDSRRLAFKVQL